MFSWISDITTAITSSFTTLGNGIIDFVKEAFTGIFFNTDAQGAITGVSNFAIFGFVVMGISVVMGLSYFVINLIRRKI